MRVIKKAATDQSVVIRIVDSGDGTPETAVEHNTAGIDLWYRREGAAKVSITEVALSALTDAHSDGGIEHIGDGYYRLDLPDAAVASGADGVLVGGTVTGMVVIGCYVPLVAYDPQDTVRLGLTALPNAAADAAGGLPISDAGGLDLDAQRSDVAAILVDTADMQPKLGTPAGASLSADLATIDANVDAVLLDTGTDGVLLAATATSAQLVDAVWDEVLTGGTHNVGSSAGRRLRTLQDLGVYEAGAIWIDTVNGTAGTTDFENGTVNLPVDTMADALTLAASVGLKHLHVVNGSTITLPSAVDNYEFTGDEYGVVLNGQSLNNASISEAHLAGVGISGTFTGNPHLLHSTIGAITGPNARIGWCALTGLVTSNGTGTWVIHSCWGVGTPRIDFGAGGAQAIYVLDWVGGPLTISGMGAGDVLYLEGRSGAVTLDNSNTGGTVILAGNIALTNNGSGQSFTQTSRFELTRLLADSTAFNGADVAAILTDTGTTLPAQIDALNDLDAAGVRTAVGLAGANLDTQLAALPTATENADALLGRSVAGGADGGRTVTSALRRVRNRVAVADGTLTVYAEDDATPDHTAAVTTTASNEVITEIDPA